MTKEEILQSSQKKVQAVNKLCEQLQLMPTAEQMVTREGFIKGVVYYRDMEDYSAAPSKPINKENDKETNKKSDNKA